MLKLSESRVGMVAAGTSGHRRVGRHSRLRGHHRLSSPRGGPCGARAQNQPRRGEDGGAHGACADGCTIDEVRRQRVGAAAQRPAGFAGKKRIELALAHPIVNDHGLLVEDDLGPRDAAAEIDAGDDIERRRRIPRRGDDIEGRKHIGDDLVALEDRDRGRRAFLHPQAFAAGIDHRHHLGRQPFEQPALLSSGR